VAAAGRGQRAGCWAAALRRLGSGVGAAGPHSLGGRLARGRGELGRGRGGRPRERMELPFLFCFSNKN